MIWTVDTVVEALPDTPVAAPKRPFCKPLQVVPALDAEALAHLQPEDLPRELRDIESSLNRLRSYLVNLVGTLRLNAEQVAGSSQTLAELSTGLHGAGGV